MTTQSPARTVPAPERMPEPLAPGAFIPPDTDPDTFISPDPLPMPDAMTQEPFFTDFMSTLRRYLRQYADVLISGDSCLYYDRGNLNRRYEPDCYIAFGVDVAPIHARNGYMVWIAGKPPDFALEIASESTWRRDLGVKRRDYARMGIREYWRFDAEGQYYGAPLAGDRLVNGRYEPIPMERREDGSVWGYSAVLGLYLCWYEGWLYFWNPLTGTFLRNIDAAEDALVATQDQLEASQDALATTREQLTESQDALATTQGRLDAVRSGKQNALQQLADARAGEEGARQELADAQEIIRRLQQQLEETRSGETAPGETEPGEED